MPPEYVLEQLELESLKNTEETSKESPWVRSYESVASKEAVGPVIIEEEEDDCFPHSKIRFDLKAIKVHSVKCRHELSFHEVTSIWLQLVDFNRISSWNRMSVKLMKQQGNLENEPDHCIRGLENKLKGKHKRTKDVQIHSIYAVLKEQTRQRKSDEKDETNMAKVYRQETLSNIGEAYRRGRRDEMDAKAIAQEKKKTKRQPRKSALVMFDEDDLKVLKELDADEDEGEGDRFEKLVMQAANDNSFGKDKEEEGKSDEERETEGKEKKKKKKRGRGLKKLGSFLKKRNFSPKRVRSPRRNDPPRRTHSDGSPKQGNSPRRGTSDKSDSDTKRDASPKQNNSPPRKTKSSADTKKETAPPLPPRRRRVTRRSSM